jgi:hypothetical protein
MHQETRSRRSIGLHMSQFGVREISENRWRYARSHQFATVFSGPMKVLVVMRAPAATKLAA